MPGRILAIGDIHGCDAALQLLLEKVAPTAEDTVVLLGDVVDKGPDTRRVTERLLALRTQCQLVYVKGNHEQMLFHALSRWAEGWSDWRGFEQERTFDSYGGPEKIPAEHIAFWSSAVAYWETEGDIFVHAKLESDLPLADQASDWLRSNYLLGSESPHYSGKRVICGHTLQNGGLPWVFDGWVCIDTAAFRSGFLTCLDVASNEIYQASQEGVFRTGRLAAPPGLRSPATRRVLPPPGQQPGRNLTQELLLFAGVFACVIVIMLLLLVWLK